MLHTMFRGNQSTGSGEEDFEGVFTLFGRGCHVTNNIFITFLFRVP